jgi:RNA polymerase sigma factor for flagellar operon FliA
MRDSTAVSALPAADEPAQWNAVRAGDKDARERLIESYLPFARMLAAKLFAGRIDSDQDFSEYVQFATVGLIEAVDRFEPERDVMFKTFAGHRINGAVMNGLEHLSEKREQISVRKRLATERRDSGKEALDEKDKDVFQQLAEVAVGLALGHFLSDPEATEEENVSVPDNRYGGLELKQMQDQVRALVENLPPRERMVIKYHYLNFVPFHLIAETLGVTKGRVSQIHRRALQLLRENAKTVKACDLAW